MISKALRNPRITCSERDQESMTDILNDLHHAKTVFTFYETSKGEYKTLFTGIGENEFKLLMMQIHRHVEFYDTFKLIIDTIDKMREDFEKSLEYANKAVEYIKLKQRNKNY